MLRLALALGLTQAGFHAFVASLPLAMVAGGRSNAEIGAVMGSAAVFNIVAAFFAGGLIDRYGGRAIFLVGMVAYAAAAMLLATNIASAETSGVALLAVRLLQGLGLAAAMPSAMSLVPGLVDEARLPTALAFVGVAANLSLAVVPPVSIVVLDAASLSVVAALVVVVVFAGAALLWPMEDADRAARQAAAGSNPRTFRPAWRAAWAAPLAISLLFVAHWGVVTGYLPQRAEATGAEVGLFYTGDALALLALRIPAGYLAGRIGSLPLVLAGVVVTAASLSLLLLPPTTVLLVIAGVGTGAGGALLLPTLMLELSHRSDATNRGSAFALFSVAFSAGIGLGSLGVAPFIDRLGFEAALLIGIAACGVAGLVALFDRALRHPPVARPA